MSEQALTWRVDSRKGAGPFLFLPERILCKKPPLCLLSDIRRPDDGRRSDDGRSTAADPMILKRHANSAEGFAAAEFFVIFTGLKFRTDSVRNAETDEKMAMKSTPEHTESTTPAGQTAAETAGKAAPEAAGKTAIAQSAHQTAGKTAPEAFYAERAERLKAEETMTGRKSGMMMFCRLALFCLCAVFIWLAVDNHGNAAYVAAALICAVAFFVILKIDERYRKTIERLRAMTRICENELACLKGDFSPFPEGSEYVDMKHEYSFDMDIFGPDSLFQRMNRTVTRKGSKRLAERLTTISLDRNVIERNREAVAELAADPEWRLKFMSCPQIGDRLDSLAEKTAAGDADAPKGILTRGVAPFVLIPLTLGALVCCIFGVLPWMAFVVMVFIQLLTATMTGGMTEKTAQNADSLDKESGKYMALLKVIEEKKFSSGLLRGLEEELFNEEKGCPAAFRELAKILSLFELRGNFITYLLFNGLFMYDVLLRRKFRKWMKTYAVHVRKWTDCTAEFDALVSLGTHAFNNPDNVCAEILGPDSETVIAAMDISHPFLPAQTAVPNSISLKKGEIAIITGANMAGKSTFLRTIGTSYVLAVNGAPVRAASFAFMPVSLFSSMRTTDNLSADISYFQAELLRLKQLLDHVRHSGYSLIILDEILKGTNSADKLNGSILVLRELIKHRVSGLVATHDLELAKLGETESGHFTCRCFEIELADEIKYTYRMKEGIARNMNATHLLKRILKEDDEERN